jgi:hypothetical protein
MRSGSRSEGRFLFDDIKEYIWHFAHLFVPLALPIVLSFGNA